MDYLMDNRNTLTDIRSSSKRGNFKNDDNLNFDSLTTAGSLFTHGNQITHTESTFRNFGGALSYKHNFAKAGKELTSDINYNSSTNDNNALYTINLFQPDRVIRQKEALQKGKQLVMAVIIFLLRRLITPIQFLKKQNWKWAQG